MKVGLVIPCYIDTFYPEVGIATLELLERLGVEVEYPFEQTCCGQPTANSGCEGDSRATEEHFVRLFSRFNAADRNDHCFGTKQGIPWLSREHEEPGDQNQFPPGASNK
jgi:Fe-S oxidoreductase